MDQINGTPGLLELVPCPAFSVKGGLVDCANGSARALLITSGTPVEELLEVGGEEYAAMESGCLSLTVFVNGQRFGAFVSRMEDRDIFLLDQEEDEPAQQALSLASVSLRHSLDTVMTAAQALRLIPGALNPKGEEDLQALNRGTYQLLRQISNMSDAVPYAQEPPYCQMLDATEEIREIMEKAAALLEHSGIRVRYTGLQEPVMTPINREKLGRAIHNLLLNAAKSLEKDGRIDVTLTKKGARLYLSITDNGKGIPDEILSTLFYRYRRRPSLESAHCGIGLGMPLARAVAAAHGGTVLVERLEPNGTRVTMTIAIRKGNGLLRSPSIPYDYAGGFDHTLMELSEVLPPELYK